MADNEHTAKQTSTPAADSPGFKRAVEATVKDAQHDARTGNVSTSDAPPQPAAPVQPAHRQGHDRRP